MSKYCPIIMVVNAIEESNIGSGLRGSRNPGDTVCGEEACALWNERKNRCGLVCKIKHKSKEKHHE